MAFLIISAVSLQLGRLWLSFGLSHVPCEGKMYLTSGSQKKRKSYDWKNTERLTGWMLVQTYTGAVLWIPVLSLINPRGPISVVNGCITTVLQHKPCIRWSWLCRDSMGFLHLGFSFSIGYPLNFVDSGIASLSISRTTNWGLPTYKSIT